MKKAPLPAILAKACMYAQEHIDDPQAWPSDETPRTERLQCVSYQMACFLAQNTRAGHEGVEWEIILPELVAHPMKTEKEWLKILNHKAAIFGGWSS